MATTSKRITPTIVLRLIWIRDLTLPFILADRLRELCSNDQSPTRPCARSGLADVQP